MNSKDYHEIAEMDEARCICEIQVIRKRMRAIDEVLADANERYEAVKKRLEYLDRFNFQNITKLSKELEE